MSHVEIEQSRLTVGSDNGWARALALACALRSAFLVLRWHAWARLRRVFCNTPQHARGVHQHEVAHAPGSLCRRMHGDAVLLSNAACVKFFPPRIHTLSQEGHHEMLSQLFHVEILQEKAHMLVVAVRNAIGIRRQGKPDKTALTARNPSPARTPSAQWDAVCSWLPRR